MENLEVHSKDFLIKWINIPDASLVSWQVKPLKRSVRFCIYRISSDAFPAAPVDKKSSLEEKLARSNLQPLYDAGRVNADELCQNHFTVHANEGGVYAFIFDNTFSKSNGKKVLFNQHITPIDEESVAANGDKSSTANDNNNNISINNVATSTVRSNANSKSIASSIYSSAAPTSEDAPPLPQSTVSHNNPSPPAPAVGTNTNSNTVRSLRPPSNPRSHSVNRERSSSVCTLTDLLKEEDENDFQILEKLQKLQLSNTAGQPSQFPQPSSNSTDADSTSSSSKFHKKSSHSSLSYRANRNRSDSQTSIRTARSNLHSNDNANASSSTVQSLSSNILLSNQSLLKNTVVTSKNGQYIEGFLLKKKRKKGSKSYTKRFFSLNFKQGVLEYRLNNHTSSTRGAVHIKLVEITANKKTKEITIDSGFGIWHLKALNEVDWEIWVSALDIIRIRANYSNNLTHNSSISNTSVIKSKLGCSVNLSQPYNLLADLDHLQNKLDLAQKNSFNLVNNLKETQAVFNQYNNGLGSPALGSFAPPTFGLPRQLSHKDSQESALSLNSINSDSSKQEKTKRRRSIFQRNGRSATNPISNSNNNQVDNNVNSNGSSSAVNSSSSLIPKGLANYSSLSLGQAGLAESLSLNNASGIVVEKRLNVSITDARKVLDTIVAISEHLSTIISIEQEKQKATPAGPESAATMASDDDAKLRRRLSASSLFSDNFFDAHEYIESIKSNDGVILVDDNDTDFNDDVREDDGAAVRISNEKKYKKNVIGQLINQKRKSLGKKRDSGLTSLLVEGNEAVADEGDASTITSTLATKNGATAAPADDLYPLSSLVAPVKRRPTIKNSTTTPPSLLQFFRKNVGKNLSSIAMPVTFNEPLTILQKFAEIFEYTDLIDRSIASSNSNGEKILYIAVFAISYLSSLRSKERSIRKPFMPLLGETFELVRDDLQYRLILEKVSHKPPIFCLNVEAKDWEIQSTIMPVDKFWGKSLEIINKGAFKLTMKQTGEIYEWNQPTAHLRNLLAGEKYLEPVDTITINCSNGEKAVVEFKAGGMFSGRSEDVVIKAYDHGERLRNVIVKGTWTEQLSLTSASNLNKKSKGGVEDMEIWKAHPLLPNASHKWGFTKFAAELNEITDIEKNRLPPTDSRLRPDMQRYEEGDLDNAENLKLELEQKQRERRKEMEEKGEAHQAVFFVKDEDEVELNGGLGGSEDEILLGWSIVKGEKGYWERRRRGDWSGLLALYDSSLS